MPTMGGRLCGLLQSSYDDDSSLGRYSIKYLDKKQSPLVFEVVLIE